MKFKLFTILLLSAVCNISFGSEAERKEKQREQELIDCTNGSGLIIYECTTPERKNIKNPAVQKMSDKACLARYAHYLAVCRMKYKEESAK